MKCLAVNPERLKHRSFVPHDINLCDWEQIDRLFKDLSERSLASPAELECFIIDNYEVAGALQEEFARIQLATSVDTRDENAKELFRHFSEEILSRATPVSKKLDERILTCPHLKSLDHARYGQLIRLLENEHRLHRDENVPLSIQDSQLGENFSAINGSMSAEFEGKKLNLTQIAQFVKEPDRALREKAWFTIADCRRQYIGQIDEIYDQLVHLRHQTARNAGFNNFRDYMHLRYSRFDYTPEDCYRFHETIEREAVPVLLKLRDLRRKSLGVDTLRPWDISVDPMNRPPLKPVGSQDELVEACSGILDRIYPRLGDPLRKLQAHGNLDLMTRQDKAVVGFNMPLDETKVSFIFMNATGTHFDVTVLLHEAGHAIETAACAHDPILPYRHTPQEWGECASQSMELLGLDHLDVLYDRKEDRVRCILEKYEDLFISLVSSARIDAFQHWVYLNPEATADERSNYWVSLTERFPDGMDHSGIEEYRSRTWQGIPHLFIVPFYYIEYGITEMSALQVYRKSRKEGQAALTRWLNTMKLGYSRPVSELYREAGLEFAFHGPFAVELIRYAEQVIEDFS